MGRRDWECPGAPTASAALTEPRCGGPASPLECASGQTPFLQPSSLHAHEAATPSHARHSTPGRPFPLGPVTGTTFITFSRYLRSTYYVPGATIRGGSCQDPSRCSQQRKGIQREGGPSHWSARRGSPFRPSLSSTFSPRGRGQQAGGGADRLGGHRAWATFESPPGSVEAVIVAVFLTSFSFLSLPLPLPSWGHCPVAAPWLPSSVGN